jgi:hypothetical protein
LSQPDTQLQFLLPCQLQFLLPCQLQSLLPCRVGSCFDPRRIPLYS